MKFTPVAVAAAIMGAERWTSAPERRQMIVSTPVKTSVSSASEKDVSTCEKRVALG